MTGILTGVAVTDLVGLALWLAVNLCLLVWGVVYVIREERMEQKITRSVKTYFRLFTSVLLAVGLLLAFATQPLTYTDMNCSQFVTKALHIPPATAQEIFDGRTEYQTVAEYQSYAQFSELDKALLHEDDVVAFNGTHVALQHSGLLMDSEPRTDSPFGPGLLRYVKGDSWFGGPIRVMRKP